MIRNLKVLGLALVALVAMSAMASSASANVLTPAKFTSSAGTTILKGSQATTNVLTVTGQTVSCKTATFSGHVTGTSVESVTVTPVYTDCTGLAGAVEAKVTGFGHLQHEKDTKLPTCDYVLRANGTADLVCQEGASVTVDIGTCTVNIKGQTGIGKLVYTNNTPVAGDVRVDIEINNIKGTHTDGFLCPFNGSGSFENGILDGDVNDEGLNAEGGNVNISHDPAVTHP